MHGSKYLALTALAGSLLLVTTPRTNAQISVNIGPAPVCPYGYYAAVPYNCAPYGYYGPEWFNGGIFIGAGPWDHGREHFWGHVDNRFDRNDGWHGDYPRRGEHFDEHHRPDHVQNFRGNEMRDGHGHSNQGAAHE